MQTSRKDTDMTAQKTRGWIAITLAAAVLSLAACGGGDPEPVMRVDANGTSTMDGANLATQLAALPLQTLSSSEAQGLAMMREEERLAHDVYAASATLWGTPIFANIAGSEATHTAAMLSLLERYSLPDPLAGLPEGVFFTPAFQALHDALVATSRRSLVDALTVGVQIEELDIRDIAALRADTDNADIQLVYDNLQRGSRNHLRSYYKLLTQQGGRYAPQYISQTEFDAIVSSPIETGP